MSERGDVMNGPVVVGYTHDASGADAVAFGLGFAAALAAPVIVVVVHPDPTAIGSAKVDAEWLADRAEAAHEVAECARVDLAALGAATHAPGVEVRLVPSASAARGLTHVAGQENAAAIVVGSSATEGVTRQVFAGSTAARLMSGGTVAVVVAPRDYAEGGVAEIHRVGIAYVDTDDARIALHHAAALATATGASLTLLAAVPDEREVVPWLAGVDGEVAYTAALRDRFTAVLERAAASLAPDTPTSGEATRVNTRLLVGDIVESLAEVDRIDLLVCGSRAYGPIKRVLLGGVSGKLVRRSRNPVMVVPRGTVDTEP